MNGYDHLVIPAEPGKAFGAAWLLTAPWAHPFWSQYEIALYDLTTKIEGMGDPILYLEGATHEVAVHALDPNHPVDRLPRKDSEGSWLGALHRLTPANHAYQFRAESDEAATARIQGVVDAINAGTVSPDTDFIQQWDALFSDGQSLRKSAGATAIHTPLDGSAD